MFRIFHTNISNSKGMLIGCQNIIIEVHVPGPQVVPQRPANKKGIMALIYPNLCIWQKTLPPNLIILHNG